MPGAHQVNNIINAVCLISVKLKLSYQFESPRPSVMVEAGDPPINMNRLFANYI